MKRSDYRKTILLVENDTEFNRITVKKLQDWGYAVVSASSGEKSISLLLSDLSIDLALIDLDLLPGLDGADTAAEMLSLVTLPIVFITAQTDFVMAEKIKNITRYGLVSKNSGDFVLRSSIDIAFELFNAKKEATSQLNRSNIVLQSIPDLLFVLDKNGFLCDCNKKLTSGFLAKPGEKIVGRHISDFLPPEEVAIQLSLYKECFETGKKQTHTYSLIVHKKKHFFDLRISKLDSKHIAGIIRDITEKEQMEEQLRESEEKYRLIFEHSPLGLLTFDESGLIVACNENMAKIVGSPREKLLGISMLNLPDKKLVTALQQALEGSTGFYEGTYHSVTSTKITPVRILFAPMDVVNGQIHDGVGIVEDITERMQVEDQLRESEERYKRITSGLTDYLYTVKVIDGKVTETIHNEVCFNITGYTITDFASDPYLWINMVVPEEKELVASRFEEILAGSASSTFEHRIICKDGQVRWISDTCIPKYNSTGELISYDGVIKDITERKQIEEKIKDLLVEKELILKEVHHRIKNNMNTINSLLNLQAGTVKDPAAVTALEDAGRRVRSMMMLYDKLYRSIDVNEISIKDYLPSLVDQIIENFPNARTVTVKKEFDNFVLDVKRMQPVGIIVNELLTNVMKYAFKDRPSGLVLVSAYLKNGRVSITIQDNGSGLSEAIDFDNSTGFGLMLVGVLTKQLKGSIRIERENGTRIILEFDK